MNADSKPPVVSPSGLRPPLGGAIVRMYRIGHGDCFLLAFSGDDPAKPVYVLIDCGYKPGSPGCLSTPTTASDVVQNIREVTGGHIDIAVITHEHQDHVNGITQSNFKDFTIGVTWMAWTEDPTDDVANQLRKIHHDKLLGLIAARNRLGLNESPERLVTLDQLLEFDLGGQESFVFDSSHALAATVPGGSANKKSMKLFKDLAAYGMGMKPLRPHEDILALPGARNVRVFVLGPPRSSVKLHDLDPQGKEEFHGFAMTMASPGNYLAEAVRATGASANPSPTDVSERKDLPFSKRYGRKWAQIMDSPYSDFFRVQYGAKNDPAIAATVNSDESDGSPIPEVSMNAEWRRIDNDWLFSFENLALAMSNDVNNSSLVLAFELGKGGKVLLFPGDAQRGNWLSWKDGTFKDGDKEITARDLLERTVFYKVGHHCSHNATLNGTPTDDYPNLSWIAKGRYGEEFTAMITAVRAWAETQKGWDHPLKAIKDALLKKTSGRVLQTDTDREKMEKNRPAGVSEPEWRSFISRVTFNPLYFDYIIP